MNASGWIQLILYIGMLLALTKPMGLYLLCVLDPDEAGGGTFLDPLLNPVERMLYWLLRVDSKKEQNWKQYGVAVFTFSLVTMLMTYVVLRVQEVLPLQSTLNPQKMAELSDHLAFNTAASFTTNTNWQSYGGESTMSYWSQMVALASHNFFSAAVGIAIAAALVRGISRSQSKTIGNFWRDLVRLHLYLLLPICFVYAIFLVSQGMIQNFRPYSALNSIDQSSAVSASQPIIQTIGQGPVASQVAIKMLGTNGGGFYNANAAHPFENPTPLSNFVQMLSIFAIPAGLTYYLGKMVKQQSHGWAVWAAMFILFIVGALVCWSAEASGNARLAQMRVDPAFGNMEGKEVRFGIFNSALFATITTDASCGAVNAMHDSFTPLGGLVPLFNMHMGEVVFGGVGAGLYGMLIFAVLAIFIAGLMVGRTPEYLGKKIESYDVKAAVLGIIAPSLCMLFFTAWACSADWGLAGLNNNGPHGFSEIHYAYTSGAANNGSAFAGLTANPRSGDRHYDVTLAIDMLLGRFFIIVPVLALAGHLAKKKIVPQSAGSFPVNGATFSALLIGVVIIVGALTFLPALALGPIVEHFLMQGSKTLF
ncbi:MAG TPA: potassium-transporting ATPase subunit KdpA [Tepidisphaeraceae bacterium]|jgi:K+-transporting ATPase ATPase A chain|nr:potassium-transporting ATPase subunit KdpA [Tepidisphaeraceae bacterium]